MSNAEAQKRYRTNSREKYREARRRYRRRRSRIWNASKLRNYARGALHRKNRYQRWTHKHDKKVLAHKKSDRELSAELGRSVTAIQTRRRRLRKKQKSSP
jgi:hypothetical protein